MKQEARRTGTYTFFSFFPFFVCASVKRDLIINGEKRPIEMRNALSNECVCKCQKETYLCVSKEAHRGEESVSGSCASVHSFFSFFSQHQTHAVAMSCTLFLCSNEVYINYTLEMNLVTYTSDTHLITKCGCMKHAQGDTHAHNTQHHHHNRMHTYMRV